jgi:hypothetical protein
MAQINKKEIKVSLPPPIDVPLYKKRAAVLRAASFSGLFLILGEDLHHGRAAFFAFAFDGIGAIFQHGLFGIYDVVFLFAFEAIGFVFFVSHGFSPF